MEKRRRKLACVEAVDIRVVGVVRFLHVFMCKKGFAFPLVRRNINHCTDVIWERRKELRLCSNRPWKWTGTHVLT